MTVLPEEVINECRIRIERRYPPTVASVIIGDGGEPQSAMMLEIERLRACQDHLLSMTPIPGTFRSDHYWQGYPPGFRFQTVVQNVAAPQAQPAPPTYYPPPQPTVVVIPQAGGQQVVYGGHAPAPSSPGAAPAVMAAPVAPMPYVAPAQATMPPGSYSYPVPTAGSPPAPAVDGAPLSRTEAAPLSSSATAQPPLELWSEQREAGYRQCVAAMNGDASARDLIGTIAKRYDIDLDTYCQRYISERATILDAWTRQQEAN